MMIKDNIKRTKNKGAEILREQPSNVLNRADVIRFICLGDRYSTHMSLAIK